MEQYFKSSVCGNSRLSENEDKRFELIRLCTYSTWPVSSTQYATKLAKVGFYYEGNIDEVVCYACGIKTSNWLESDEPDIVHKQLSPDCEFFTSESNNIPVKRESVGDESDIIQRLENLEVRDFTQSDQAEGNTSDNRPDCNLPASTGSLTDKQPLPKSKSADQISSNAPQSCPSSLGSDSCSNQIPRSTSYPGSSIGRTDQQRLRDRNLPDASADNNSKASASAAGGNTIHLGAKTFDLHKLRYEKNRLETFKKWPIHIRVPPQDLAKSGFFFTGVADRVFCVFCKGALRNWDEGDRPNFEHRKHFPKCRFILGLEVGNVPLAAVPKTKEQLKKEPFFKDVTITLDNAKLGNLGIITEKPKHSRYSIYHERLGTFKGWPITKNQTPEKLAEAGFFYAGFGDNVKCFYCNGGLRNWEPGDEPWNEHAKWFKKCPFIKQVKGEAFIQQFHDLHRTSDAPILSQLNPPEATGQSNAERTPRRNPLQSDQLGIGRVEEREIRARMDGAMAQVVEKMGIGRDVLTRVIRKRLMENGDDFTNATDLIEAVFKQQEEDERYPIQSTEIQDGENQADPQHLNDGESNGESNGEASGESAPLIENSGSNGGISTEKEGKDVIIDSDDIVEDAEEVVLNSENDGTKKHVDYLEKENQDLKEQRLCKICMVADSSIVFLPCGHLVACADCSPALDICPICREPIKGFVRTFIA